MFCNNCGQELREGAAFCVKCGAKVGELKSSDSSVEKEVFEQDNESFEEVRDNEVSGTGDKTGKSGKENLALIFAAVSLLAFLCDGFIKNGPDIVKTCFFVLWIGGSIVSLILMRHNPLKDCAKVIRAITPDILGCLGILIVLFVGYFLAGWLLIAEVCFPILPVGIKYVIHKMKKD